MIMRQPFYLKLAMTNLRSNKEAYFPYALATSTLIGLFFMLDAMRKLVAAAKVSDTLNILLNMGVVVAGIVSVVVIFYINSILTKRRRKELGLYSVLGLEKRHVARVFGWEVAATGLFCLITGILGGILLSRLLFLILLNLLRIPVNLPFFIPLSTVLLTMGLFVLNFLLVTGYHLILIHHTDSLALMQGGSQGEREPKTRRLMTILGLVALAAGYGLSLSAKGTAEIVNVFLPAVLLVILATYLLFIAGSIALLKMLRRNKRFYYKSRNFIAVSGMLYRMKQNAEGLANICILSTCVLVVLSGTICFYVGQEDVLRTRFPKDVRVGCLYTPGSDVMLSDTVAEHAAKLGVTPTDAIGYESGSLWAPLTSGGKNFRCLFVPLKDYNRLTGQAASLEPGELLLYDRDNEFAGSSVTLASSAEGEIFEEQKEYSVLQRIDKPDFLSFDPVLLQVLLVVSDLESVPGLEFVEEAGSGSHRIVEYVYSFNLEGTDQQRLAFCTTLREALNEKVEHLSVSENIFTSRQDFYSLYGTLVFLGAFFVILFAITTVLIIYYKQISEGYDDRNRFCILRQVGLDEAEVRRTIRRQVMIVFFLPLMAALVHISVAFPSLCKMMAGLNMRNVPLFLACTVVTAVIYGLFYWVVYHTTAKTYYRLVQKGS